MTVPVTFRQASPADLEPLVSLIHDYYQYDTIPFDEATLRPALARFLSDPTLGRAWLAEVRGQTAGYLIATFSFDLEFDGRTLMVTDLFLRESYRRQGVGRAALAFLEGEAPNLGVGAIELQAQRHNEAALAFYRTQGFERYDRVPMIKRLSGG
jgi:GNAT superfamily N-acetyltransferase